MSLPLAIVAMILILAGIVLYFVFASRLYRRLRGALVARGYKSPAALTLAGAIAFAITMAAMAAIALTVGPDDTLPFVAILVLAVPIAMILAVRFLPARDPRRVESRKVRFPYRRVGVGLLLAAPLVVAAAFATGKNLISGASLLAIAGLSCLEIARRAALADAASILATDPRAPVLYLRAFRGEDAIFAEMSLGPGELWREWLRSIARRGTSRRYLTLESYLKGAFSAAIGPLVALGNPLDFVPPDGAARAYADDAKWIDHFRELAAKAAAIVMTPGSSEPLLWELNRLKEMKLAQRLFVLTKPRPPERSRVRAAVNERMARFLTRLWRPRADFAENWPALALLLTRAGYRPLAEMPGAGAVIGFDGHCGAVLLMQDARSAAETVSAIAGQLRQL